MRTKDLINALIAQDFAPKYRPSNDLEDAMITVTPELHVQVLGGGYCGAVRSDPMGFVFYPSTNDLDTILSIIKTHTNK